MGNFATLHRRCISTGTGTSTSTGISTGTGTSTSTGTGACTGTGTAACTSTGTAAGTGTSSVVVVVVVIVDNVSRWSVAGKTSSLWLTGSNCFISCKHTHTLAFCFPLTASQSASHSASQSGSEPIH